MHNTHLPRRTRGTTKSKDRPVLKYFLEKTFKGKPNSHARANDLSLKIGVDVYMREDLSTPRKV